MRAARRRVRVDGDGDADAQRHGGDGRGRGRRLRRGAARRDGRRRLLGSLAFSERGTGAHFYAPELRATAAQRRRADLGTQEVRDRRRPCGRVPGARPGQADGDGRLLCDARRRRPASRSTAPGGGSGWPATRASRWCSTRSRSATRSRVGAAGAGAELVFGVVAPFFLVGLAAVNVGIAAAAARAATAHAAEPPLRRRRDARGGPDDPARARRHGHARRAARLLVHEAARLGDAGDPTPSSRSWRRRWSRPRRRAT